MVKVISNSEGVWTSEMMDLWNDLDFDANDESSSLPKAQGHAKYQGKRISSVQRMANMS